MRFRNNLRWLSLQIPRASHLKEAWMAKKTKRNETLPTFTPETWFSLINMPPSHLEHVWIAWSPAYHFPNGPTSQGREFRGFGGRLSRGPGAQGPCLLILAWRRSKNVVLRNVLKHVDWHSCGQNPCVLPREHCLQWRLAHGIGMGNGQIF